MNPAVPVSRQPDPSWNPPVFSYSHQGTPENLQAVFCIIKLLLRIRKSIFHGIQNTCVQIIYLLFVKSYFHTLVYETESGNRSNTVLFFILGSYLITNELGEFFHLHAFHTYGQIDAGHHVGTDLYYGRGAGIIRQIRFQRVKRTGNLDHGAVEIRIIYEFQLDHAVILITHTGNTFDTVYRTQRCFHGLADLCFDLFGTGSGIGGEYHQIGQ